MQKSKPSRKKKKKARRIAQGELDLKYGNLPPKKIKKIEFDGVEIEDTAYGLGVFATRSFDAEDPVGPVEGIVIDDKHYSSNYCMDLGGTFSLEPDAPFRFLNHRCNPNCQLVQYTGESSEDDDHGLWIEAIRKIKPGEQLTIDYAWPAESAIPCGCDSTQCRGWIVDVDQVDELPDRIQAGE